MNTKLLAVLGLAMSLSGPALADRQCLVMDQIWNWHAVNDQTLIVEDNSHHKFKVSLMAPCINLTFKERIGFKSFGGTGLSCLSKGDDVLVRNPGFPERCPITDIQLYTPDMEKADKAAAQAQQQSSGGAK